jgi:nitroreductase
MEIYEALYTTRAMRRVKPDPIPLEAQARILDAAVRAPSGGNAQTWRFVLVDDTDVKSRLGPLYRASIDELWKTIYADRLAAARANPEAADSVEILKIQKSAQWLADNFERVPLFLLGFVQYDSSGGSIFPAVWSAQLAARAEGIGSALTSILGVMHGAEALEILGVPRDEGWIFACMVSFGYPTGRWGVAQRMPADQVAFRNLWGEPIGMPIPGPMWP